jgi:hypothetical protein
VRSVEVGGRRQETLQCCVKRIQTRSQGLFGWQVDAESQVRVLASVVRPIRSWIVHELKQLFEFMRLGRQGSFGMFPGSAVLRDHRLPDGVSALGVPQLDVTVALENVHRSTKTQQCRNRRKRLIQTGRDAPIRSVDILVRKEKRPHNRLWAAKSRKMSSRRFIFGKEVIVHHELFEGSRFHRLGHHSAAFGECASFAQEGSDELGERDGQVPVRADHRREAGFVRGLVSPAAEILVSFLGTRPFVCGCHCEL